MARSIYVMRSVNINATENFLRSDTCTLDTIHTGRAMRVKLIKMFMTSTESDHMV